MLTRARMRWAALCVLLASLVLMTGGPASAATSGRVTLANTPVVCVQGESKFNWYTTGFADRSAWAFAYARTPGSCSATLYRPPGWLAVRFDVFKWTGSQWALCRSTDWQFGGGGDTRGGDIVYEQSAGASQFFSSPPCGSGYYGTSARHLVWDGAAWQGGNTWSGYMFAA